MRNRFKELDLIDRVPDELWREVHDIVQETGSKPIPKKKKCRKTKWLSEEALQIALKRREVKSKGEKERFSSVQLLSHVWLFATPWTAAHRASLSIANSWSLLKLLSIELLMPSNHLILCGPLPDILECDVKWALGSITTNKPSGSDGIPVELFQTLKDDAVTVLHSICQQIWKTQQRQ